MLKLFTAWLRQSDHCPSARKAKMLKDLFPSARFYVSPVTITASQNALSWRIHEDHGVQLLALHRQPGSVTVCLRALSKCCQNVKMLPKCPKADLCQPWCCDHCPGDLFSAQLPFANTQPNPPWHSFRPRPRVLPAVPHKLKSLHSNTRNYLRG